MSGFPESRGPRARRRCQTRDASEVNEITDITSYITPFWATPAYDDAGNMTSFPRASSPAGAFTATYDAWNRLMTVKQGANFVAAYQYDGLWRRLVKKSYTAGTLTETRDFYFSDQWQILSEAVGGTTDTTYVWGLRYVDELLWRVQSSTRLYAMQDANFNCTAIGNTIGSVVERYQFTPYGTRTVLDASWSVIGASAYNWVLAHQGLMIENDVGLYDCRNRVYSPLLGVWLQRDPLGYVQDAPSFYSYLNHNPVARIDPLGLFGIFNIPHQPACYKLNPPTIPNTCWLPDQCAEQHLDHCEDCCLNTASVGDMCATWSEGTTDSKDWQSLCLGECVKARWRNSRIKHLGEPISDQKFNKFKACMQEQGCPGVTPIQDADCCEAACLCIAKASGTVAQGASLLACKTCCVSVAGSGDRWQFNWCITASEIGNWDPTDLSPMPLPPRM